MGATPLPGTDLSSSPPQFGTVPCFCKRVAFETLPMELWSRSSLFWVSMREKMCLLIHVFSVRFFDAVSQKSGHTP